MVAFAPPSTRGDSTRPGPRRLSEAALLTLALGLSLFSLPNPPDSSLDGSWQEMLVHAHAAGLQFGRDLIFTWGPWGFLCSLYHLGRVEAVPLLLWQTAGQLLVALSLVILTGRLALWRRIGFAALFVAAHWLFLDVVYFVLITLVVVSGLMRRDAPLVRLVGWTLVLGFLAQIKFTYLALSAAGAAASMACWAGRRSWARVGGIGGAYGFAVVAAWVAAGQSPDNLYPYLRRSAEVALGYGDAMGLDEPWSEFIWGLGLALVCALWVGTVWRTLPERSLARAASCFLGFALFLMWKESYTRADLVPLGGHVFGLFAYVLILAPALSGLLFPDRRWHWFDGSVVFCLVGIGCFDPAYYTLGPRVSWEGLRRSAAAWARLGALPEEWQRSYEEAGTRESLPATRAAVGRATVDVYDFNQGVALLNGLDLDPRPIFQGYSAYTPSLEGWNLRHYQSDRAPEFLLWSDQRVDDRYPGEDDAMLVAALPGHYEPLFPEGRYWLFRRRSPLSGAAVQRRPLLARSVRLSEEVTLPPERDQAIWLEADAVPNNLGRLRAAIYKPAAINLATTDDQGRPRLWRVLPRVARLGFVLVPTLESGGDVASFLRGEAHSWVRSFHFEAPAGQEEFWSRVDIAVFGLPGIALRPTLPFPQLVELGIFDRRPVSVTSATREEIFDIAEGHALLLHAESEVILAVPSGAGRVTGSFGIREGAYTGDGHTEGVGFDLDAVWASGRRERLWSRYLDPVGRPGDRGTQHLDVGIPADPPFRLVLHMGPRTTDDNRWAWSYVAALRFDGRDPP